MSQDYDRFKELTFDKFKELANDPSLSVYEKIGFPVSYRQGFESAIFKDITQKLCNINLKHQTFLDIGSGCSDLANMLIDFCQKQAHTLILVDSKEMLAHLPNADFIIKIPGRYPQDCHALFTQYTQKIDAILCYSVLHYIYAESNVFDFVDKTLSLLNHHGQFLIGDIPNISKRQRFFASPAGEQYHQRFTGTLSLPKVTFNTLYENQIDDNVLTAILSRSRSCGFDAYLLPQANDLPMSNRREDILIIKP
jgi:hypothetical protein